MKCSVAFVVVVVVTRTPPPVALWFPPVPVIHQPSPQPVNQSTPKNTQIVPVPPRGSARVPAPRSCPTPPGRPARTFLYCFVLFSLGGFFGCGILFAVSGACRYTHIQTNRPIRPPKFIIPYAITHTPNHTNNHNAHTLVTLYCFVLRLITANLASSPSAASAAASGRRHASSAGVMGCSTRVCVGWCWCDLDGWEV